MHDVGVIVGRFQVHELHDAHKTLINEVLSRHDKVILILGLSPLMVTQENPLDFQARKQMLLAEFPSLNVLYIKDRVSDQLWSKDLDAKILDLITPAQKPMLYGGRDSFIAHYKGRFDTEELEPEVYVRFSGTDIRKQIASRSTTGDPNFRAGVVWASQSKFPTCYPTVDVVILGGDGERMLLCRKPDETKFRFIGGFADPRSPSYEADVRREVAEEAHIEITDPKYVGSVLIDDWRYRREVDKIKTLLFTADHMYGSPQPDDDIVELRWFDNTDVHRNRDTILVPTHHVLFDMWWGNA